MDPALAGPGVRRAEVAGRTKAFAGKQGAISDRRPGATLTSPARRGFCPLCPACWHNEGKGRA